MDQTSNPVPQAPAPNQPKVKVTHTRLWWLNELVIGLMFLALLAFIGSLAFYFFQRRGQYLPGLPEMSLLQTPRQSDDSQRNRTTAQEQLGLLDLPRNLDVLDGIVVDGRILSEGADSGVDPNIYKNFTGQEFTQFYNDFEYQHVTKYTEKPAIKGDPAADAYIQSLAEERGYKLRSEAAVERLVSIDGERLHPEAAQGWQILKASAAKEGINLFLVSGYRSADDQKGLFLNSLGTITSDQILSGELDEQIDKILVTRSIPGYSKHHTGYTIDIGCSGSDFTEFKDTECYQWISKLNYTNAKRFGFIPSYPENSPLQGPDPEAWEYVWVGESNLRK